MAAGDWKLSDNIKDMITTRDGEVEIIAMLWEVHIDLSHALIISVQYFPTFEHEAWLMREVFWKVMLG